MSMPTRITKSRDTLLAVIVAAGFILFQYAAQDVDLLHGAGAFLAILGLAVAAGAVATLIYDNTVARPVELESTEVPQPALSRFLFHDTRSAALWLVVRFYLGFQWLEAGWHKFAGTGWMDGGASLKGYWTKAIAVDPKTGTGPISNDYGWYRGFLQFLLDQSAYTWFAKAIVFGEILVGVGLIVGGLVGIAAFFGALMNMSFMLAGSASTNPVLFVLAVLLMLAWKNAGYIGLDRVLLPALGTPWKQRAQAKNQPTPQPAYGRA
jgi:thiosulfate dehydrogenase [quinone] large subunit